MKENKMFFLIYVFRIFILLSYLSYLKIHAKLFKCIFFLFKYILSIPVYRYIDM